jgi:hypothetical protein
VRYVPNERFRCSCVGTQSIVSRPTITIAAPAPILHPAIDKVHANKQQQTPRNDLWEDFIQFLGWDHGHRDLDPNCA